MKLVCEICYSYIGNVDKSKFRHPIRGDMFTPTYPKRGLPPPFDQRQSWEDFRCPICNTRPIIKPGRVMIDHPRCFESSGKGPGYFNVPVQEERPDEFDPKAPFSCPDCGRTYSSYLNFQRYHKCPVIS